MTETTSPAQERFGSVDTFRGAVLALMLFTPTTGATDSLSWLRHAEWNGLTVSDWLFPTFLVTSGLSLSFLLRGAPTGATYRRLFRRLVLLLAAGLAYNAYGSSWFDLSELRFTGVLQMIGIAGAVASVVVLASRAATGEDRVWWLAGAATVLIVLHGLGLEFMPCEPVGRCSPYLSVDTGMLGASHVYWSGQAGWDPEGIVTSIAAASLVLYGYAAGVLLRRHGRSSPTATLTNIGTLAALCLAGGLAVSVWMLPNKRLLTPAFVLLSAGIALIVFCAAYLAVDRKASDRGETCGQQLRRLRRRDWQWPFVAFGRNALIVFLLERFLLQTARHLQLGDRSIQDRLLEDVLPFGEPAVHLTYTAVLVLLVLAVVGPLHRRRRYLAL